MDFNISPYSGVAVVQPERKTMSAGDKLGLSAMTAARTKANDILNAYKNGKKPTWEELEALIGQTFLATTKAKPLDYMLLGDILEAWVRKAPERAAAQQQRMKAELEATARRTYQSFDLPLPNGLALSRSKPSPSAPSSTCCIMTTRR